MADIIQLLPDAIANQIAAGEVIQRPASVVKELLENAIDAGSSQVKLIIKDAGKTLIQVIDNGCGMSATDARLAFARHATSKIRKAEDIFAIRTMGFRGEALASMAAIAQVELKTRRQADELGTRIFIEGSEVKSQESCQCAPGSSFSIKNLFYNTPARRNFLKSNTVEMRHILDEFLRLAIAHPDVFFTLHHNNTEVYHLPKGNLRQRIVNIFGNNCNKKLVPLSEETDILKINGFVGKPEFAKRTRGEQFFFVNNRFIKSGYLNHALMGAYEELLPKDTYPLYVIFIDIDPSKIDVNVHPTKQEIKFEDEKLIYNYLKVAIRHALGQYSITPTLDFNQENNFSNYTGTAIPQTSPGKNNPSSTSSTYNPSPVNDQTRHKNNLKHFQDLYDGLDAFDTNNTEDEERPSPEHSMTIESKWSDQPVELDDETGSFSQQERAPYQIHGRYIVSQIKSGFLLIDQQAAHERILYERYIRAFAGQAIGVQKLLFPKNIELASQDAFLLKEILEQVNILGFDIQEFGTNTFVIHGIPADLPTGSNEQQIIEKLLELYKQDLEVELLLQDKVAQAMARSAANKHGQSLTPLEMTTLIDQLFACSTPYKSPRGKNCFITFELDELEKRFSL